MSGGAFAEAMERIQALDDARKTEVATLNGNIDTMWVLVCGVVVFLMQLGFCFLEAGAIRATSVTTIMFKNLADCCIGALMWWFVGYSLAFGGDNAFIGGNNEKLWAMSPEPDHETYGNLGHWFLSFTYMTTAATIVSGAVAERISLTAYAVFVVVITGFSYPTAVHWIWSTHGWLSPFSDNRIAANGVLDFAGSVVLHGFGGISGLTIAWLLGPRKLPNGVDVFSEEGQALVAPHNKLLQAAGTLLLWFSWYAFNAGSVAAFSGDGAGVAANAMVTTMLASAASTITCMLWTKITTGYYNVGHCCNAALAGLVAITAGCAYVRPCYAVPIGVVGFFAYQAVHKLRIMLRIDDVVDAGAVHWGGGVWGGLATGLFADQQRIRLGAGDAGLGEQYGLFLGGGGEQFGMQLLGCVVVSAWGAAMAALVFFVVRLVVNVRVEEHAELSGEGLDMHEHNDLAFDYLHRADAQEKKFAKIISGTASVLRRLDGYFVSLSKTGVAPEEAASVRDAMRSLADVLTRASSESGSEVNERLPSGASSHEPAEGC